MCDTGLVRALHYLRHVRAILVIAADQSAGRGAGDDRRSRRHQIGMSRYVPPQHGPAASSQRGAVAWSSIRITMPGTLTNPTAITEPATIPRIVWGRDGLMPGGFPADRLAAINQVPTSAKPDADTKPARSIP